MPTAYLTRRERFSAAHRLFKDDFSDNKNDELYGKCSHPNWHGHNYELYVTIKGDVDPEIGYIINLKELSKIINTLIISKVDHKNLNIDVDFLRGQLPSTETLAISFWKILENHVKDLGAKLYSIKVQETENNFAEYFGD